MEEENNRNSDYENQETNGSDPYGYYQNDQQNGSQNQGYNRNYYGQNGSTPQYYRQVSGFASASLVLGILSLLLACCSGIGGIAAGALGIIFAILSRKEQPMERPAKIGLITSIVGFAAGCLIILVTILFISTGRINLQDELRNELGRYGYEFYFGDDDDYDNDYDDHNNHNYHDYDDFHDTNEL